MTLAGTPGHTVGGLVGLHFPRNFIVGYDAGQCISHITESLVSVKSLKGIDFTHLASSSFDCGNRNAGIFSFLFLESSLFLFL